MGLRFTTGVDVLDRELGGGIRAGSLVALSAPPTSQSERLLYELTAENPTLYATATRAPDRVEASLREAVTPRRVAVESIDGTAPASSLLDLVGSIADETLVVVDPAAPLERASDYRTALSELRALLRERESVAVFHCVDGRSVPDGRDVTEYVADVVLDLSVDLHRDRLRTRLTVPKCRRDAAPREAMKLNFRRGVTVDNSRDIA